MLLSSSKRVFRISNHSSEAHEQFRAVVVYQAAVQEHVPLDKNQVCQESFPLSTGFLSSWPHLCDDTVLSAVTVNRPTADGWSFTYIIVNSLQMVAWIHDHSKWSRHCVYISTPQSGKVHRSITVFYQKQTATEDNFFCPMDNEIDPAYCTVSHRIKH